MTFPTDPATLTRRQSLGIWIGMCGSYYFKALPRIFQRIVFSQSKVHARRLQARIVSASATPGLRGTLNHPRRAPTAFGTASHVAFFPSVRERKRVKQYNP